MRSGGVLLAIVGLLLTACARFSRPTPPGDENVVSGDGWTRLNPGRWTFQMDEGRTPDMGLTAFGDGQGILRIELPRGATGAEVESLSVSYVSAGPARWMIYAEIEGAPASEPQCVIPVEIDPGLVGQIDGEAVWVTHAITAGGVSGPFYAVFARDSDLPAAEVGAVTGVDSGRLTYREYPDAPPRQVPHLPLVRVTLRAVH